VVNSLIEREHYSAEEAIRIWLWGLRNLERVEKKLPPEQVFSMRMEDLCRAPGETVNALCRFLGVAEGLSLDYTDLSQRHVVGNTMRLKFDGTVRHDEGWRRRLAPEHLALFEARAGAVNRRLGYGD